jgi:hypothetical protein
MKRAETRLGSGERVLTRPFPGTRSKCSATIRSSAGHAPYRQKQSARWAMVASSAASAAVAAGCGATRRSIICGVVDTAAAVVAREAVGRAVRRSGACHRACDAPRSEQSLCMFVVVMTPTRRVSTHTRQRNDPVWQVPTVSLWSPARNVKRVGLSPAYASQVRVTHPRRWPLSRIHIAVDAVQNRGASIVYTIVAAPRLFRSSHGCLGVASRQSGSKAQGRIS